MTPSTRIFVYGTLRSGDAASGLLRGCRRLGPGAVRGTLFDVGGRFPALVLEGDTEVHGEVWSGPPGVLERLDEYEGVEEGLFRRVRVEVGGEPCWSYVAGPLLGPRLASAAVIEGGDWRRRSG